MKPQFYFLMGLFLLTIGSVRAQSPACLDSQRFSETPRFTANQLFIDTNWVYGYAPDRFGTVVPLKMSIVFPKLVEDTLPLRPVLFLVHGGGFVAGTRHDLSLECVSFAQRGFVVVTIDYRLGHNCAADTLSHDLATYRAQQDARAAMRYLVHNAAAVRADTSWIFVGGGSAGAATVLAMQYLTQAEADATKPALRAILGPLDSSGNALTDTYTLKGIYNNWGAVSQPFFDAAEALPTVAFHGDADPTVHIDSALGSSCTQPQLNYGSRAIHQYLSAWGVCSDLSVKVGGLHGVYQDTPSGRDFRVSRAACFFRALMCGGCATFYSEDSIAADCYSPLVGSLAAEETTATLAPNPSHDGSLRITLPVGWTAADVQVRDLAGACVHQARLNGGGTSHPLDLSALPAGLYLIALEGEGGQRQVFRFVIAR